MSKKVWVLLAEGFEEVEALAPIDILRRGGLEVSYVLIGNVSLIRARVYGYSLCSIPLAVKSCFYYIRQITSARITQRRYLINVYA